MFAAIRKTAIQNRCVGLKRENPCPFGIEPEVSQKYVIITSICDKIESFCHEYSMNFGKMQALRLICGKAVGRFTASV